VNQISRSIPQPLVRANQWFIVSTVLLALATNQAWILFLPFVVGLSGLILNFNPVMRMAKLLLKNHPSTYIPEDYDQQQFNQKIAVICLGVALVSYYLGWIILFYIFSVLVSLAAFIAILGFCVGCYVRFQFVRYRHKRKLKHV
jgi:FtsH-binding integral membrane protein